MPAPGVTAAPGSATCPGLHYCLAAAMGGMSINMNPE